MTPQKVVIFKNHDQSLILYPALFQTLVPADELEQSYWISQIPWQQNTIQVFGKQHNEPRLTFWMGPRYKYSSIEWPSTPFLPLIEQNKILSFGQNLVLMEFGFLSPSQYEAQALFNLQVAGYVPVIAHYERYPYYFGDFKKVDELRERNILIQVNLNSLTGHYGPGVKKMAEQLIKNKQVDFLGTDCHRMEHLMMIERSLDLSIYKHIEALNLKNNRL